MTSVYSAMRESLILLLLCTAIAGCSKPLVFRPMAALPLDPSSARQSGAKISITDGNPVNPSLFPASYWMYTSGTYCSASIVGPNTLLLAGHCIKRTEPMDLETQAGTIKGTCYRHPEYSANGYLRDLGICILETDLNGIAFERVSLDSPPLDETVVIAVGFGCDGDDVAKTLRVGVMAVDAQPSDADDHLILRGVTSVTVDPNGVPVPTQNATPPVLCPGDSGGATYSFAFPLGSGPRSMVAVNSTHSVDQRSAVTSLGTPQNRTFIQDWAGKGAKICGLTPGLASCHS
jgi:trypsin